MSVTLPEPEAAGGESAPTPTAQAADRAAARSADPAEQAPCSVRCVDWFCRRLHAPRRRDEAR
jgi:hypothetical protein